MPSSGDLLTLPPLPPSALWRLCLLESLTFRVTQPLGGCPRSVPWLLRGSVGEVLYLAGHGCRATRVTAAQKVAVPGQAWAPFQRRGRI